MFKEVVEVESVFGNKAQIKFSKKTMCSCCRLGSVCGSGQGSLTIDSAGFSLAKGDRVEVAIDEKKNLLAAILTFLIPAVVFLASLVLFKAQGEINSFLLAIGALCLYYLILKLALKKQAKKFNIQILRKI